VANGEVANRLVTARKQYRCESFGTAPHFIDSGVGYVRTVMFPGDVNSSDRPWVMRICTPCWQPRPLPPERTVR
jgi:hypothetical protein